MGRNAAAVVFLLCAGLCALPGARAEATDATKSESTGTGLQFATAGKLAQFTVTAKDESGVRRTSGGDEWIVELDGTRSLTGSVVDNLDGTYQVSYTATKSGSYEAGVKLAKSGGLTGSYFENVWFFYTPVKVTVDPQINMDWGTGLITPTGANYISIRWVGKVKTQYAETYTFYATTDDGARLWVDNVPLIDRWDSYCNETSATIALKANVFYNIKMEYKQVTGSAFAKLAWASQSTPKEIVPSSQLYYETQAKKSPFSFIVMPNVANGTRSTAAGTGLVSATAGTGAQFTIQANDMYDNERGEGGDIFSVRVYPPGSIEVGAQGRAVHGVVVDNTDSSYSVEYTTYKSGNSTLYAALLVRGGVTATYYDNQDFTIPVKYAEGTTNLQMVQFSPITSSNNENSVPTVADFSVRYAGFVEPTKDSQYQFAWYRGAAPGPPHLDRVKVWVDNSLIIDQWTSLQSAKPTGTIELRSAYYYDTKVEYRTSGCTSGSCDAMQKLQWAPSGGALADLGSTNLYRGYNVMGSPYSVHVNPAGTCAAKSIAIPNQAGAGHSLELATAGLQAEFTITSKDLYGNLRGSGGDNFKVRLTGVDSTSGLVQDLSPEQPGAYRVVYTATKSGTYDVSIVFGASGINQSPFRVVVQPARRHLATSVATGVGLTLATAGVATSVTITVKDRHENWQPDPSVVEAGIQFNLIDATTLQPVNVVQAPLGPDDIPRFVDTVSYIGPATNAGHQVATPTDLDNPRLILTYTATRSGQYSLVLGGTRANDGPIEGSPFDLTLYPNVACAAISAAVGDALSLATAGMTGQFTIQARDQYNNLRGFNSGDNFVARVRQYYSTTTDASSETAGLVECGRPGASCKTWETYNYGPTTVGGRDKPAAVTDTGDGTYVVSYDATRSTTNYLWASFAVAGGLQATYYPGSTAFGITSASTIQVDQTVDFSVTASVPRMPGVVTLWSARWTGLVRPSLSETYTFHAGEAELTGVGGSLPSEERVKLWVDNSLIIRQWNSLAMVAPTGHIDLIQDQFYEILLVAKTQTQDTTKTAPFYLKWSSNHHAVSVISSSRLFQSYHVEGSPFALNVMPATTCAGTSRVRRPALTLTTAGIMASFTVQSKDAFDNIRTLAIEDSSAFDFAILANSTLPADDTSENRVQPSEDNGGMVAYQAHTFYIGNGGYQVNYTATRRGVYNVRGQIMQPGGVFGTYFENDDLSDHGTDTFGVVTEAKAYQRMDSTIDFQWNGERPVPAPSLTMKKDIGPSYFSARWQGMVKPMFSEVYTFHANVDDGAKVWVNGLLIIDQWYSRCSEVDGTIALMADTLYPLKIEYKQIVGNATMEFRWSSRSQSKDMVPSSSLFSNTTTYNLCNRNQALTVEPAVVCASTSTAQGAGLTGATAGRPAKFTIQSRDEYMNNRKLSDAGIRPGSAAYFCDDWAHSGTVNILGAHTSILILLDDQSASTVDDYYLGRTITITSGTGAGQARIISDYVGATRAASVNPPFTVTPDATTTYSITNYGGQFSEKCDETRTQAFREGFPEFHVRVTPVIEGSQAPYHASGIIDAALIGRDQQGSGITRLSSLEYPGGLTATYYDLAGVDDGSSIYYDPGFASPLFATWCTTAQPCDETIDFSVSGAANTAWKRTYGEFPEALANVGVEGAEALAATYYDHMSAGWMQEELVSDKEYGVRWSGFISPTLAGVYTFHTNFYGAASDDDDRVKLWIDNQIVIQQWNSLAIEKKAVGTFYFANAYPSAYTISMHYKNPSPLTTNSASGVTLRWDNLATGTTIQGVHYYDTTGNGFCSNTVSPTAVYNAATLDEEARGSICLATVSSSSAYTQVLSSPFGTISDVDDDYIGQVISYTTAASYAGTISSEFKYIHDYYGVKTGTCRKAGTATEAFLDNDASTVDNFYVGHWLHITAGTGVGQVHLITGYTGCDKTGCDPYSNYQASATTTVCDCSDANARKAVVATGTVATDATSKYRIALYRAHLHVAHVPGAADAVAPVLDHPKNEYGSFSITTGYTLVTYGSAECAEYTGTAQGGGPTTTTEVTMAPGATTSVAVADAELLFGQLGALTIPASNLYIATSADRNIAVTGVATNTLTCLAATAPVGVTCSDTALCTITPRNTIVLDPSSNTVTDFYASTTTPHYIQIISGTCAGQWRKVVKSKYWSAQDYVTAAVLVPWSEYSNSDFTSCAQPDATSIYYMSKSCVDNKITLQTVGPISSLTVKPGSDGEAILQSAQAPVGTLATGWNPVSYEQTPLESNQYPYPYKPYDFACCKALSGNDFDDYYNNMLIVITSGTGRGQRRFTTGYQGDQLLLTVAPQWKILPDSTSRYALYRARETTKTETSAGAPPLTVTAAVVPSTRLFPLRSRYEVTYTPTVKGDYQVHATLAEGSGLDATYYDDMDLSMPVSTRSEDTVDFDIAQVQQGMGSGTAGGVSALALSDSQSFSVRWAGLLQVFDHENSAATATPNVFTFEAGIAETDERVKLWVDNSLIIDRWETYDYLSGTTFSATIGLMNPHYYDIKMEYKQYAGAAAKAVLRWQCSISGAACLTKSVIPSSNLFKAREISGSPFPPHEVQAGATCADRSTVRGIALSLATAGVMDTFTIQAHDEYDNERGVAGDMFVVRALPYNTWDKMEPYSTARGSKDCIYCPSTVRGTVMDMGDSSYVASLNGTKKGAYKVLTSLASEGGLSATYYKTDTYGTSLFHRLGQVGDSEADWPVECTFVDNFRAGITTADYTQFDGNTDSTDYAIPNGAWRGTSSGAWGSNAQCQNWIKGTGRRGSCAVNTGYLDGYQQCQRLSTGCTVTTQCNPAAVLGPNLEQLQLSATDAGIASISQDSALLGTIVVLVGDPDPLAQSGAGRFGFVQASASSVLTIAPNGAGTNYPTATPATTASRYLIYDCGSIKTVNTAEECEAASSDTAPTLWFPGSTQTMYLGFELSDLDKSYEEWNIKITGGTCKGQVRRIAKYFGRQRMAVLANPWSSADGIMTQDAYGASSAYSGCAGTDETSTFMLYRDQFAPGSMDWGSPAFGVRWAGFVKPSSTAEYTFQALLSAPAWTAYGAGTPAGTENMERIKLWVDNQVIIDQWASIASTFPSGTIAFSAASGELYDIQIEYLRTGSPSGAARLPTGLPFLAFSEAAPGSQLPPRMSLRWKNEQSGSDAALSEAYDYKVITSSRLFAGIPVANSRVLDLQVAGTNAAMSIATGDGLSTASAGVESYFTITAKDSFGNERELEEDSFVVTVDGPNDFRVNAFPVPSPSMPGTYQVSYVATQSGGYDISVRRATAGGLMGEYFNNMWLLGDPAITAIDPEVDYDWGSAAIAPMGSTGVTTGADYMSVRWSGMIKPELSETYTFFANVDNGARLYVDGSLVVDQWEVSAASEYSATLATEAGLLYELKLEYRHVTGDASAQLLYSSPSVAKRIIPSARLFSSPEHVYGSPFKTFISPSGSCGTSSVATGEGLSVVTAGHTATFVLQARDAYLNAKTKWEDTFVVKASQVDHLGRAKAGIVSANVVKGKYNVAFVVTKAGAMNVYASLAVAGGIQATYYDSVSSTYYTEATGYIVSEYGLPAKAGTFENVHANNKWTVQGGGTCACSSGSGQISGTPDSPLNSCDCLATSLVQDNVWAARWSGLIRPSTASVYTFHTMQRGGTNLQLDEFEQRVKLWLDNKLVVDQWNSLAQATPTATFAFPVANDYYELDMEYRSLVSASPVTFYDDLLANINKLPTAWLAAEQADVFLTTKPIGSAFLARSLDVSGSPFPVSVMPDVTDFAVSTIQGDALTIATAGAASEFTITSMDSYGNLRTEGGDQYLVHVSSVAGSVFEGAVTDVTDGTYTVTYTPSIQGTYDVKVYLGSADKTMTLLVEPGAACASTTVTNGSPLTTATAGYSATFTIQAKDAFKNLLSPQPADTPDFLVKITSGDEVHNNPVSYIGVAPNTNLGRFTVAYRATRSGTFSVDIKLAHSNGLLANYYRDDSFTNLVLSQVDSKVEFVWGKSSPVSAVGIVDGFSVSWTGYVKTPASDEFTFYPLMKEVDERVKLWVDDQWIVDQWTSLGSVVANVQGTLWLAGDALYDVKLEYKDMTGSSSISLEWAYPTQARAVIPSTNLFSAADSIAGSPFTAAIYPSKTSGTVSTGFGAGLSVATAGVDAEFTIQARDHLGNPKTTSDDIFVVRARHNADYKRRNVQGTVSPVAGNTGQYSVKYTPTWKRNRLSCATASVFTNPGAAPGGVYTCDPAADDPLGGKYEIGLLDSAYTTDTDYTALSKSRLQITETPINLRGAKHKFHDLLVSQAERGGLMATYYSDVNADTARNASNEYALYGAVYRTKIVPTVSQTFSAGSDPCIDSINAFGVRYAGFFSPPTAEDCTFTAAIGGTGEARVRLWIDNSLIIDQWASLDSLLPTGQLLFGTANGLFDTKIEYKNQGTEDTTMILQYEYAAAATPTTIPSSRLYQAYDLSFKVFDQVGLTATYYDSHAADAKGAAANNVKAVQESTVDWSGAATTDRPYPASVANGDFSVRWTGFIKPSRTDEYTFFTELQGGSNSAPAGSERVQLWIDNTLVITQWISLGFFEPSGTISFPSAEEYYNIVMDYKVDSSQVSRGFKLQWQNLGLTAALFGNPVPAESEQVSKGVVPADRLFSILTTSVVERDDFTTWDTSYYKDAVFTLEDRETGQVTGVWDRINGCPAYVDCTTDPTTCKNQRHNRCRGQGIRMNDILRVDVAPGPVCASRSTVSDNGGLSLSTAGITRTFMLTARDEFDNQRDAVDDSFIARAILINGGEGDRPFHSTFTHKGWADLEVDEKVNIWDQNGKYSGSYIITRSGAYSATIQTTNVEKTGTNKGLFGSYFSTNNLLGTVVTQVDTNINFNWGRGAPTTSAAIVANQFSARWTGFVRTNYTEVYTFYTNCDYGVRLYVDDLTIINRWGAAGQEYSGTFDAKGTVLYDITLEYQTTTGLSFCELWFQSASTPKQVIPTDDLFVKAQTISDGDKEINVVGGIVSGSASTVNGTGLSIATAGIPASFTILSKDMYGNTRDLCNDIIFVRMVPDEASECESIGPATVGPGNWDYDWTVPQAGNYYSCSARGKFGLATTDASVMWDGAGGPGANHGDIGTTPIPAQTFFKPEPYDFGSSWTDLSTACTDVATTGNKHPFAYVQTRAGSHTIYASEVPGGKGASYVTAVGTGLMATYYETSNFGTPRNTYDCRTGVDGAEYDTASCNTGAPLISNDFQETPASLVDDGIFSVRWAGLVRVTTDPKGLTALTPGLSFRVTTAQNVFDERVKLWVDNSLIIDQWSSLKFDAPIAVVNPHYLPSLNQMLDVKLEYKNVVGGVADNSDLALEWDIGFVGGFTAIPSTSLYPAHAVSGQPLRVRVNPNVAFARECEVYGNGLTLATAGIQATFAIQSKDAYNNRRGTGGDLFIVRAFSDGCQVISMTTNAVQTCQPYGPAVSTCGGASDPECPAATNPPPETNDGGDDDGDWSAPVLTDGTSLKTGGAYRTDYAATLCPSCPRILRADVTDNGDGTYRATFTGTQKGRYTVVTSLVNSGGLLATYYGPNTGVLLPVPGTAFPVTGNYDYGAGAVAVAVDQTVDWSAAAPSDVPAVTPVLPTAMFHTRWVGFVRPSRASQYTFHTPVRNSQDRVKLWVDNSILIQQWETLSSTEPSGTLAFAKANGYYDISMVYKCEDPTAQCLHRLEWENTESGTAAYDVARGVIPSDRLFQRYDVPNTGLVCSTEPCIAGTSTKVVAAFNTFHTTLALQPGTSCGTQSTARGDGLTLSTAGVATSFTIQSKDAYENVRDDSNGAFTVDLFGSGGSPIYNAQVAANLAPGTYTVSYTAENAKNYDVFVKFGSDNIKGSPFPSTIKPAAECGTKSTIQGTGLTAASISPSKSAFTIQARDMYGNAKTQALSAGQFVVRVPRTSGAGMQGTNGLPPFYHASAISTSPTVHSTFNTPTNDGKYSGYYQVPSTPSPTGYTHYLYASYATRGGLFATYYSDVAGNVGNVKAVTPAFPAPVDVSAADATQPLRRLLTIPGMAYPMTDTISSGPWVASAGATLSGDATDYFIIRYSGLYKPGGTSTTFQWSITATADRVRLWVDNKLIIDQWVSLSSVSPSASYLFDSSTGLFDFHAELLRDATAVPTATTPTLNHDPATGGAGFVAIPTANMYTSQPVSGSPYAVTVSA